MSKKKVRLHEYNAIFEKETGRGYSVWVPDLPGCSSQGETFEDALVNIQEAIELYLEAGKSEFPKPDPRKQFMAPVSVRIRA